MGRWVVSAHRRQRRRRGEGASFYSDGVLSTVPPLGGCNGHGSHRQLEVELGCTRGKPQMEVDPDIAREQREVSSADRSEGRNEVKAEP